MIKTEITFSFDMYDNIVLNVIFRTSDNRAFIVNTLDINRFIKNNNYKLSRLSIDEHLELIKVVHDTTNSIESLIKENVYNNEFYRMIRTKMENELKSKKYVIEYLNGVINES